MSFSHKTKSALSIFCRILIIITTLSTLGVMEWVSVPARRRRFRGVPKEAVPQLSSRGPHVVADMITEHPDQSQAYARYLNCPGAKVVHHGSGAAPRPPPRPSPDLHISQKHHRVWMTAVQAQCVRGGLFENYPLALKRIMWIGSAVPMDGVLIVMTSLPGVQGKQAGLIAAVDLEVGHTIRCSRVKRGRLKPGGAQASNKKKWPSVPGEDSFAIEARNKPSEKHHEAFEFCLDLTPDGPGPLANDGGAGEGSNAQFWDKEGTDGKPTGVAVIVITKRVKRGGGASSHSTLWTTRAASRATPSPRGSRGLLRAEERNARGSRARHWPRGHFQG